MNWDQIFPAEHAKASNFYFQCWISANANDAEKSLYTGNICTFVVNNISTVPKSSITEPWYIQKQPHTFYSPDILSNIQKLLIIYIWLLVELMTFMDGLLVTFCLWFLKVAYDSYREKIFNAIDYMKDSCKIFNFQVNGI